MLDRPYSAGAPSLEKYRENSNNNNNNNNNNVIYIYIIYNYIYIYIYIYNIIYCSKHSTKNNYIYIYIHEGYNKFTNLTNETTNVSDESIRLICSSLTLVR